MDDLKTAGFPVPRFAQHLDGKERMELMQLGKRRFIGKNKCVFRAGEPINSVCLVERGYLKIFQPTSDGKEMLLFFRAPGDLLGLRGSLQMKPNSVRTYTAQACEDSEILCIPVNTFREYLESHPRMAIEIAATLSRRLDDACDHYSNLAVAHVAARVARLILYVGRCYGTQVDKGVNLDVPLTQQEIADMVGAARQTVNSILNSLYQEGVVTESHKHLRIENEAELRKLAESKAAVE